MKIYVRRLPFKNHRRENLVPAVLFACCAALTSMGCKSRSYNTNDVKTLSISTTSCLAQEADRSLPLISSPSKSTLTYHWTYDTAAETTAGAIAMVKSRLAKVASEPITTYNDAFGPGLYVAADPLTSRGYGDTLLIVPVRRDCQFGFTLDESWGDAKSVSLVKSSLAGIVYPFGGKSSRALVIRSVAAIDVDKIESVSMSEKKEVPLSAIPLLPINGKVRWIDALRHYGNQFLWHMSPDTGNLKSILSKTRTDKGNVTDQGLLFIKMMELVFPSLSVVTPLQNALRAGSGQQLFPWCHEKTEGGSKPFKRSIDSLVYGRCYMTAIGHSVREIFPEFASLMIEESMSVTETNRTLVIAGLLPANWNADTPLLETGKEVMRQIWADGAFVAAAAHIYKVSDALDTEDFSSGKTLNDWPAPAIK